ncbi:MAG: hypothetical protein NTZ12_07035 [Candidatus Aminicenantes bacterium]|nr:hypothetical protein [Candidatus Aminicenantes bacterium]
MSKDSKIRWGWLKAMYIYTIVGAGGFGVGMIIMPELIKSMFTWPAKEPIAFGIVGSVYAAFGLLSILGLRSPLKFAPVLLLQLCYKSIWFIGVVFPLLITGHFPGYALPFVLIFASYIIGDLIAIPFYYVFAQESKR